MSAPLYDDPCTLCAYLRAKLVALISGDMVAEIEFIVGTGSGRRIKKVPPNLDALNAAIRDAQSRCDAVTVGTRPKRFATIGRFGPRGGWGW